MRHLVYVEPGRVEWQEVADPELTDPASVLVEPLAVARCDLDPLMAGLGVFPGPYPVGHEVAGRVVAVGHDVTRHRVGELVVVPFQVSCGRCDACRRGAFAACITYRAPIGGSFGFGAYGGNHGGGVADLLTVPAADHLLFPAPADVSIVALATLPDNVVDGYRAVGPPLDQRPGAEVLILAAVPGSLALYAAATAMACGAGRVRYTDRDEARVAVATTLGADATHHTGPWPKRFEVAPITVDVTGEVEGLHCAIRSTEPFGTCTELSIPFEPATPVPMLEMYTRGITLHASRADSRRFLPEIFGLIAGEGFDPLQVPVTTVSWEQAAEAWLEPAVKLVVVRR